MDSTVGLIGLGLMGSAMSATLRAHGYKIVGFDADAARREEHARAGGEVAHSVGDVAAHAPIMLLSLPNSTVGQEVCFGDDGVRDRAVAGSLVVDTTTGRPDDMRGMAEGLGTAGIRYVDATISGNADQARTGDIVAMVGGEPEAYRDAEPVLSAMARNVHHVGPVGAGAQTKLIVNLVLGVHRMVLAEGLVLGEKAGLDLERLLDVLKDGAAYSRAMEIWGPRMVAGDHFPPASRIRQNHKDFRLIVEQGQAAGSPTFLASTVAQLLGVAETKGLGHADNSAVAALLRDLAGLPTGLDEEREGPGT